MGHFPPDSLTSLLDASDDDARDRAWDAFILEFNALIMHVARRTEADHDAVMDRYAFIIHALREGCFRRLRKYKSDDGARFTTWLLVVTRRLCLDQYRARYGRAQSDSDLVTESRRERRRLADLISNEFAVETLQAPVDNDADAMVRRDELTERLNNALADLPARDRVLLRFRFEDDLSVPQIARLVGADTPFTIYRRLDKVLRTLRKSLQQTGVSEPLP